MPRRISRSIARPAAARPAVVIAATTLIAALAWSLIAPPHRAPSDTPSAPPAARPRATRAATPPLTIQPAAGKARAEHPTPPPATIRPSRAPTAAAALGAPLPIAADASLTTLQLGPAPTPAASPRTPEPPDRPGPSPSPNPGSVWARRGLPHPADLLRASLAHAPGAAPAEPHALYLTDEGDAVAFTIDANGDESLHVLAVRDLSPDFNRDGLVDRADLAAFALAFTDADPRADADADGLHTAADTDRFTEAWAAQTTP